MTFIRTLSPLLRDLGQVLVQFPIWWYTQGAREKAQAAWRNLADCGQFLHLGILLQHLFVPLYGTKGWEAYWISIFMRIGHFFLTITVTFFYTAFFLGRFVLWLLLPLLVFFTIAYQVGIFDLPRFLIS